MTSVAKGQVIKNHITKDGKECNCASVSYINYIYKHIYMFLIYYLLIYIEL